eukprot:scaffold2768_cov314-Prasinococcus_capsulatus_cf.AAC.2
MRSRGPLGGAMIDRRRSRHLMSEPGSCTPAALRCAAASAGPPAGPPPRVLRRAHAPAAPQFGRCSAALARRDSLGASARGWTSCRSSARAHLERPPWRPSAATGAIVTEVRGKQPARDCAPATRRLVGGALSLLAATALFLAPDATRCWLQTGSAAETGTTIATETETETETETANASAIAIAGTTAATVAETTTAAVIATATATAGTTVGTEIAATSANASRLCPRRRPRPRRPMR